MFKRSRKPLWLRLEKWIRRGQIDALPVRIDRRRVYVLPTRFGLFFALVVFVMAGGALNYNNNPALLLALMLGTAGLAGLLTGHLQLSGLVLRSVHADPVHAGANATLRLSFNAVDARPRVGVMVGVEAATAMLLMPAATDSVVELHLPMARRGWHEIDKISLWTTRPMGLAHTWTWLYPTYGWVVYPALEANGPPLPETQADASRMRAAQGGDDVHQLRAYRKGDPMRAIAWKASAKSGALLAREYEQAVQADLLLSWIQVRQLSQENAISRLAHWVVLADRQGRRFALQLPGMQPIDANAGLAHRHACLEALARLPEGLA